MLKFSQLYEQRNKVFGKLERLPKSIRMPIRHLIMTVYLFLNYLYDFKRFLKYSGANGRINRRTNLRALLMIDYHRIEKALALKHPRVGFGRKTVDKLLSNLQKYLNIYGADDTASIALNVLFEYYLFNEANNFVDTDLFKTLNQIKEKIDGGRKLAERGGTKLVTREQIHEAAVLDLSSFFERRYSIRNYSESEVEMSLIERAVQMAQKTPSVCNRQSARVFIFSDKEDKAMILSHQNGNRGFGEQVSKVLLVTSDCRHFVTVGERNQCWIDGGMFAMSLVYALHSLGLGTCCLNWCVDKSQDFALRQAIRIEEAEAIIMMIAVGHLPDELHVTQSPRKALDEVMIVK